MNTEELQARYGKSKGGNFYVKDTIGVPHPYMITARHVAIASDRFGGMLGEAAIESAETSGTRCGMRGCRLSYKEHEQALLVACRLELKGEDGKANPELHAYLLACKEKAEADKFAGFAFLREE